MRTFTDTAARVWTLALSVDAMKRVKALTGVDFRDAASGRLLQELTNDPVLLCDVLYAVVKPEAEAKGVSDEEFGRGLAGDVIDQATTALLEELVDFFPLARRGVVKKLLAKVKSLEAKGIAAAEAWLEGPEPERMLAEAISGALCMSSPASPE